ncbi:hypothetical protein BJX68DRAFT_44375 [Aspergillus pseudodeflectus]|uniref:Uncharacterized protein n=1 Tax=Aspergillus pseudodeflectus TaxID=176178 RepID=A0ABR4KMX6_9EURO
MRRLTYWRSLHRGIGSLCYTGVRFAYPTLGDWVRTLHVRHGMGLLAASRDQNSPLSHPPTHAHTHNVHTELPRNQESNQPNPTPSHSLPPNRKLSQQTKPDQHRLRMTSTCIRSPPSSPFKVRVVLHPLFRNPTPSRSSFRAV